MDNLKSQNSSLNDGHRKYLNFEIYLVPDNQISFQMFDPRYEVGERARDKGLCYKLTAQNDRRKKLNYGETPCKLCSKGNF